MGDVFIEQLVPRKNTGMIMLRKILILFAGLLVFLIALYFILSPFAPVALLVAFGAVYFAWVFVTNQNVEFEYIYTNGEIDIDKIMAKRKRKRLLTLKVSSFDSFDEFSMEWYRSQQFDNVLNASAAMDEPGNYYAVYRNREGKRCLVVLSPEERLLNELKQQFKRKSYGRI